ARYEMSPKPLRPAAASLISWQAIGATLGFLLFSGPQLSFAVEPRPVEWIWQKSALAITARLPQATAGIPYTANVIVTGGPAPYEFRQTNLPPWLDIDQKTGVISGVPQYGGQYQFKIYVEDARGNRAWAQFTLQVASAPKVSVTVTPG